MNHLCKPTWPYNGTVPPPRARMFSLKATFAGKVASLKKPHGAFGYTFGQFAPGREPTAATECLSPYRVGRLAAPAGVFGCCVFSDQKVRLYSFSLTRRTQGAETFLFVVCFCIQRFAVSTSEPSLPSAALLHLT